MTKVLIGDRIGKRGVLRVGCTAVIFDATGEKVLLTQRADNGQWCLPGGAMEPGESAAEACVREVYEETGLHFRIQRLISLYSNPDRLVEYPDGNRVQVVALNFEAEVTGGALGLSNETTAAGYFSQAEIHGLELLHSTDERLRDAFARRVETFIR